MRVPNFNLNLNPLNKGNRKIPRQFIVVDDDASNNFICERAIHALFPESTIRLFTHPESALKAIEKEYREGFEKGSIVLFLDINMPHLGGWEFLEEFEKLSDKIQQQFSVYIVSSSIDKMDQQRAASNSGVLGFLSKPLIVKELQLLFKIG
jgi:CheY-like chemotaxis protein